MQFEENEYRQILRETLDRIEQAFDGVDPDVAECEQALGSMTIVLPGGARCILSAQPSVRQLWLAVASKGVAFHFNYDSARGEWVDDKGRGIELLSYLRSYLKDEIGLELKIP